MLSDSSNKGSSNRKKTIRQFGEIDTDNIPAVETPRSSPRKPRRDLDPRIIFKPDVISSIRGGDYQDDAHFARQINESYGNRRELMAPGYEDAIDDKETFAKKLYLARMGKSTLPRGDTGFSKLWKIIKEKSKQPPSYLVSQLTPSDPIPEEVKVAAEADPSTPLSKTIGTGYGSDIPCSISIFDDISRLEILIGGKRAENNSPELINEATEICQRLFLGRIMDIGTYRRFVDELVDDYVSD